MFRAYYQAATRVAVLYDRHTGVLPYVELNVRPYRLVVNGL